MRNVWTIARRELRVYFTSPIGYIVLAANWKAVGEMPEARKLMRVGYRS